MVEKKKSIVLSVLYQFFNVVCCAFMLVVLLVLFRKEEYGYLPMNLAMIAVCCGATYAGCQFTGKFTCKEGEEQTFLQRLKKSLAAFRNCLGVSTLIFAVYIGGYYLLAPEPVASQVEATGDLLDSKPRVKKKLLQLKPEVWKELSLQDKVDLLQMVVNIECDYWGMIKGVRVATKTMEPYVHGLFQYDDNTIYINPKQVEQDTPWAALDTVIHEQFHAYQYEMMEMYLNVTEEYRDLKIFEKVKQYDYEARNYINDSADYKGYSEQSLEEDARLNASERITWYYSLVKTGKE